MSAKPAPAKTAKKAAAPAKTTKVEKTATVAKAPKAAKKPEVEVPAAKPVKKAAVAKPKGKTKATPAPAAPVAVKSPVAAPAPVKAPAGLTPRAHTASLPVYEPGRPLEEVAREFGFKDADRLIKLASNENPLGPSPKAIMAMQTATGRLHLYPDGGCYYLRHKLARLLGAEPAQFIFGAGSNEILEFLGKTFLEPGLNLVMSSHSFIVYKLIGLACAAEVREAPMKDYFHDLDAMLALVDGNTRLFFIANPNNPTGSMVGLDALRACLAKLPPHVLAVLDEAYIELLPPPEAPDTIALLKEFPNLIILRTFSKAYGLAGLRIGYGISTPAVIGLLEKYRQPFNVSSIAQAGAMAALDDHDHLYRTRYNNDAGVHYFENRFKVMKLEYVNTFANFILVKTGRGREIFREMQKKGVIVRAMDAYGLPDHIRISVGTPEQNRACIAALQSLLQPASVFLA